MALQGQTRGPITGLIRSARVPKLTYLTDEHPGLRRIRRGDAFFYTDAGGKRVTALPTLERISRLAIPPAWTDVWISPRPNTHLQATGRDARGRKQYRYHPAFRAHQEQQKYRHLAEFAAALPAIRRRVARDMRRPGLPREKVLATVVALLERTLIRVGNEDYARANHSYGLTTLRDPHVDVRAGDTRFHFKGKSGKTWKLKVSDRRIARIVKSCQDLPGQHLFQYREASGKLCTITSGDVNTYLREIAGPGVSAKDFRTWAGTVLAACALARAAPSASDAELKRTVKAAVAEVAERLGNTVAICRKCYVHPAVIADYVNGQRTLKRLRALALSTGDLKGKEAAVLSLVRRAGRDAH
jgi:DNA topoisomerase-1